MKNVLVIDTDGEKLVSSVNDGTNRLFINGNEIASSNWIGSGNYTDTVNGHAITIAKAPNLNGNYELIKVSDYNYKFVRNKSEQERLIDLIYPVGSIYMSVNAVDPGTMFEGTEWEQIKDTFLLAAGSEYANGDTGGESEHLLTAAESGIPAHAHGLNNHTHGTGGTYSAGTDVFLTGKSGDGNAIARRTVSSGSGATNQFYGSVAISRKAATGAASGNTSNNTAANASTAHNNMPPYLAVNVWERTA